MDLNNLLSGVKKRNGKPFSMDYLTKKKFNDTNLALSSTSNDYVSKTICKKQTNRPSNHNITYNSKNVAIAKIISILKYPTINIATELNAGSKILRLLCNIAEHNQLKQ